ncbi:MAG: magnesium transporter CorA family protein [Roseburia sp.]|uniref:magnesium transporter CorA family protein n=1 Tax=Roseburia sp. 831b TaxID=1261635 RepID=UPI0009511A9C|nr:magnesium transporter CorA family protein [Roseburia sp. 831b]MCI5919102.1 magnesium transporter CorA family protein [Roseburia sp.]MDD6215372.1 magnesium transporter CorA family protein [Roseburia sp.]MDY5883636.1 magnesium transporter CorA family protein [Roseburia sp.]WVK72900.1 magnesium transporter CorA family protein [Roseburia sp. 831b]
MVKYYRTDDQVIHEQEKVDDGVWVQMIQPTLAESQEVADMLNVDIEDIQAALDEEESSRIELQDGYTLILVDIPTTEIRHEKQSYTTIPLGIILTKDVIVTICTEDTPVLQNFTRGRVKEFSTKKKLRFVYQILYRTASMYQSNLRTIDKKRTEIEERVGKNTEDVDLIDLHELESTLVYFATSLRANGVVLDRLTRYKRLEQYPEDKELLGDVIVENRQAIEMTSIYRDIINGTRELLSSVIDNRLNNVMKYLTSITIVMAIPTVISGIYGMNVNEKWMPFANVPHGFLIICVLTFLICLITLWILKRKKML